VIAISLRLRDQPKPDMERGLLAKMIQSIADFGVTDLEIHLDRVTLPVCTAELLRRRKGAHWVG